MVHNTVDNAPQTKMQKKSAQNTQKNNKNHTQTAKKTNANTKCIQVNPSALASKHIHKQTHSNEIRTHGKSTHLVTTNKAVFSSLPVPVQVPVITAT